MSTVRAASSTPMRKSDTEQKAPKPIDLGYERPDYGVPVPSDDGDEQPTVTAYPQLDLNDIKLPAGTPETGEARITYRVRRVDTGGESSKPSVTLEIRDICFCGDADWEDEGAEKETPVKISQMLAKAVSERQG